MTLHRDLDLFAPTPEHALLADTLEAFVAREVEPQAAEHDRDETFNHALFRRAGELGLLGVTLPEEYGGAGLDAGAAAQACEVLSTSDAGVALAVPAHAVLFAQNVNVNGIDLQRKRVLPKAASGEWIESRLGAEGEGTRAMMRNLEIERLTLAAMSVGIAKRCLRVMTDYANQRKSFGVPVREHGQIQRYLAETFAEYRAAKALVYDTARRLDLSAVGQRVDADASKLFASQVGKR